MALSIWFQFWRENIYRSTELDKSSLAVEEPEPIEAHPPAYEPGEPHTATHNATYGTIVPEYG